MASRVFAARYTATPAGPARAPHSSGPVTASAVFSATDSIPARHNSVAPSAAGSRSASQPSTSAAGTSDTRPAYLPLVVRSSERPTSRGDSQLIASLRSAAATPPWTPLFSTPPAAVCAWGDHYELLIGVWGRMKKRVQTNSCPPGRLGIRGVPTLRCFEIRSLRYASNDPPIWDRVSFTHRSRNPQEL